MIQTFGPKAQRFAQQLRDPKFDAIFADMEYVSQAYPAAVQARQNGVQVYGMVFWDDPRCVSVEGPALHILQHNMGMDDRLRLFASMADGSLVVNGKPLSTTITVPPELRALLREFIALVPAQLFRSVSDCDRFTNTFGCRSSEWDLVVAPAAIPDVTWQPSQQMRVVVWAPETPPDRLAIVGFALEELHAETWIVCAEGEQVDVRAHFIGATDRRVPELLSTASCVVVPAPSDPSAAIAFAERGFPLVVTSTSGAAEFIARAEIYEPWDGRGLFKALLRSVGRSASCRASNVRMPPALRPSGIDWTDREAPLVSVVITTYNRPDELREALACVVRQTYPNIECIVVNDAGTPVGDVCNEVSRFNVRLIDLPENVGVMHVLNKGLRVATGRYICAFSDDDRIFPDFIERLVEATEGSGSPVAHTNTLARYMRRLEDGSLKLIGYNATVLSQTIDPTGILFSPWIAAMSMLVRRDLYETLGYYDETSIFNDYEIYLRFAKHVDIVHVNHFSCEFTCRTDASNFGTTAVAGEAAREHLAAIFEQFPLRDRPALVKLRENTLRVVAQRPSGMKYPYPPTFVFPGEEQHA
jgi:hypothetical protein